VRAIARGEEQEKEEEEVNILIRSQTNRPANPFAPFHPLAPPAQAPTALPLHHKAWVGKMSAPSELEDTRTWLLHGFSCNQYANDWRLCPRKDMDALALTLAFSC